MMKKFLLLFLLTATVTSYAQESTLLRLNYTKGDQYVMKMDMTQEVDGAVMMTMNMGMSINVNEVKGDVFESTTKISKIKLDMNQGGMNVSFDSSKSDDELDDMGKMMKSQMGPMMESVIYTKGNNLGEVLDLKVEPNMPGVSDMTNQNTKIIYPKNAVRVGDSWDMDQDNKGMKMNFIYTVKAILPTKVMIELSGTISGITTGTISGSMDLDRNSGVPIKTVINMAMSISNQDMKSKMVMEMTKK